MTAPPSLATSRVATVLRAVVAVVLGFAAAWSVDLALVPATAPQVQRPVSGPPLAVTASPRPPSLPPSTAWATSLPPTSTPAPATLALGDDRAVPEAVFERDTLDGGGAWATYHRTAVCTDGASTKSRRGDDWLNGSVAHDFTGHALPPVLSADEERWLLPPGGGVVRPALGPGTLLSKRATWREGGTGSDATLCDHRRLINSAEEGGKQPSPANRLRVLAVGHSHTRYCLSVWCMMGRGGAGCKLFDKHERNVTVVDCPRSIGRHRGGVEMTFLQSNFDLRNKLWQLVPIVNRQQRENQPEAAEAANGWFANATSDMPPYGRFPWPPPAPGMDGVSHLDGAFSSLVVDEHDTPADDIAAVRGATRTEVLLNFTENERAIVEALRSSSSHAPFDAIVVSRGAWDMLFLDRNPATVAVQLARGIRVLAAAFPGAARVVLHMPHWHVWNPAAAVRPAGGKRGSAAAATATLRTTMRRTCFAEPRQRLWRDVNLCAVHLAAANDSELAARIALFDFFNATTVPFAQRFVDALGHHYLDVILEEMSLQLWRAITANVAAAPASSSVVGMMDLKSACRRVAVAAETHVALPECSCMQERAVRTGNHSTAASTPRDGCQRDGRTSLCCRLGRTIPIKGRRS